MSSRGLSAVRPEIRARVGPCQQVVMQRVRQPALLVAAGEVG